MSSTTTAAKSEGSFFTVCSAESTRANFISMVACAQLATTAEPAERTILVPPFRPICSNALAKSMSAEAPETPAEVANSLHAEPPGRVLASGRCVAKTRSHLNVTALPVHRR